MTSGVFDRFPKLQLVVTEGAQKAIGKVLHSLYRLNSSRTFKNKRPYLEYFKNNMFCTIDIEMKESFNILMKYIGSDRLLFSTDYPHIDPSGLNKWNDTNDLYNAGLSPEDLENIAYRNAEKLFRIK